MSSTDTDTTAPVERRLALHRSDPVKCESCGRTVARKGRGQRWCSDRCRERAKNRTRKAGLGGYTGAPPTPQKIVNEINGVRGPKSQLYPGIFAPAYIVRAEVFTGRQWAPVVSDDGVVCHVRRKPAARKHKAEPAVPDTKPAKRARASAAAKRR
jgi:hypothetical protein